MDHNANVVAGHAEDEVRLTRCSIHNRVQRAGQLLYSYGERLRFALSMVRVQMVHLTPAHSEI